MKRLPEAAAAGAADTLQRVDSLCPYCGVGCALTYVGDGERIHYTEGRDGAANAGRLCVKGRYGFDYAMHPQRLTKPLIRRAESYPRGPLSHFSRPGSSGPRRGGGIVDYAEILPHFREASWEEALDVAAVGLKRVRDTHGGEAMAGFGSAKGSNEEAYLVQKLVRAAFGSNNVDHCTRLCHASSVYALIEGIGSGAVTNVVRDVANAEVALLIGCNPTENHPVAASFMKQAAASGTKLLVANIRRPDIADYAEQYLQIRPGTDVALLNAMLQVIISESLHDRDFVADRTEGFEALAASVRDFTPEVAEHHTGVPAAAIREFARSFARARSAMLFWGMGISQHTFGTDNARALIALALLTGNVGRSGTGLHPLRGQNNVQGASDMGLIPMFLPDYASVTDDAVRGRFERHWGVTLPASPGRTVTEITEGALSGEVKALYCMGENPFLSDPDMTKVREALSKLDFLVVQDIFATETAEFADVILPASSFMEKLGTYTNTDRRVQIGRPARALPGEARQDWEIVCALATRMGYPMRYDGPEAIFEEIVELTPGYANLSYATLGARGKWYPFDGGDNEGRPIVFGETFPRGRAKLVPATLGDPRDLPDADFDMILATGRTLQHWHTGTMTRRSRALDALAPKAFVEVHPQDAHQRGIADGDWVELSSRRGAVRLQASVTRRVALGTVFMPMHFREAAANLLTNPDVDPFGKIPDFKYCAVRVVAI